MTNKIKITAIMMIISSTSLWALNSKEVKLETDKKHEILISADSRIFNYKAFNSNKNNQKGRNSI